mgnify:CR=1 FL=1
MDRSATRLAAALASARASSTAKTSNPIAIDLTARSGALAVAGARQTMRSLLYARDAVDEWSIAAELRPPTVRAYEAAAAEFVSAAAALDEGWRSVCAACGQEVRVAAWRWDDPLDADRRGAQPTARRATCAACRAIGRRGGDAGSLPAHEIPGAAGLDGALRARVAARFSGPVDGAAARWSERQLRGLDALSAALERSTESAAMLVALRLTVTEAALAMARPLRSGRPWWEIAPWQAVLDAIDARRRIYLTATPTPSALAVNSDLAALAYPSGGTILLQCAPSTRAALVALATRTPSLQTALLRITVGGSAVEASDRAIAARWAGAQDDADPLIVALQSNGAVGIAAALARLFVAINPLMLHDPLLVIECDDDPEQIAGIMTALSLAGAAGSIARRLDDERTPGLVIVARHGDAPSTEPPSRDHLAPLVALVAAHGEPVQPRALLPAYAAARAQAAHAAGVVLDAAAFAEELRGIAEIHATLRPAGSLDPLVALPDGRVFVEGRAERERLAAPAADRFDAAAFALAAALGSGAGVDEAYLALDGDPIGVASSLRTALLDAYTVEVDGGRQSRATPSALEQERRETIAALLELGPRMGLHAAVAPALARLRVGDRTLGARSTVDPIDPAPPLRTRSDRAEYDAVDAVLYRRGRVVLFCEVVTGPCPLGDLLLRRHAKIASDREVVRLLVLAPTLVPVVQERLAADLRLAEAWEEGNWHLLAVDRIAALARLAAPRLADLEGHLGAEPPAREAAQLDLSSLGWGPTSNSQQSGGSDDAFD